MQNQTSPANNRRSVLVVSGFNPRAVLAFCRWASSTGVTFHIAARGDDDPILLTDHRDRVFVVRDSPALDCEVLFQWAEALRSRYGCEGLLVLPSTEYLNRFLLAHRTELEAEGFTIPLADEALYARISDKKAFVDLCVQHQLDVPAEYSAIPPKLPFVAKPKAYASSTGRQLIPHLVCDDDALERFRKTEDEGEFFIQEFVAGRSLYLLACIRQNGEDVLFSQENLVQQAEGGSVLLARGSDLHLRPVAQQYAAMLHNVGFTGVIMIEVRHDERTGRYAMIEANPRLWGPMQFVVDSAVPIFDALLEDNGVSVPEPLPAANTADFYCWQSGITAAKSPLTYHNYSPEEFVAELSLSRRSDVYLRPDSMGVFLTESQGAG